MSTPLTPEELAEVDGIKTYAQHRAFCDKVKAARGGAYPSDWYEKMLASGKNDEVADRYDAGKTVATERAETALEIVKRVIAVKIAEEESAKKRATNRAEKERLLQILAEKQAGALTALTEKELQDRINALDT